MAVDPDMFSISFEHFSDSPEYLRNSSEFIQIKKPIQEGPDILNVSRPNKPV